MWCCAKAGLALVLSWRMQEPSSGRRCIWSSPANAALLATFLARASSAASLGLLFAITPLGCCHSFIKTAPRSQEARLGELRLAGGAARAPGELHCALSRWVLCAVIVARLAGRGVTARTRPGRSGALWSVSRSGAPRHLGALQPHLTLDRGAWVATGRPGASWGRGHLAGRHLRVGFRNSSHQLSFSLSASSASGWEAACRTGTWAAHQGAAPAPALPRPPHPRCNKLHRLQPLASHLRLPSCMQPQCTVCRLE